MTLEEARKILDVSAEVTLQELKVQYRRLANKYHPDKGKHRDGRQFILINSAYMLLLADGFGISKVKGIPTEVAETLDIRDEINNYLDNIIKDFRDFRSIVQQEAIDRIDSDIYLAGSKSELKKIVKGSITRQLLDLKTNISSFIIDVKTKFASDKNQFVFNLFSEMYEDRRRYWLLNLWKNPILIFETIGLISIFSATNSFFFQNKYPEIWQLTTGFGAPLGIIVVGAIALTVEYLRLSPENQFVPPRISLDGLHTLLQEQTNKLGLTDVQAGLGGSATGLFVGTVISPGIGTFLGGILGYFFGSMLGKSLSDMKDGISSSISKEIEIGFQQIENRIALWVKNAKDDLYNAVMDSFYKNAMKVARLAGTRKLPLLEYKK